LIYIKLKFIKTILFSHRELWRGQEYASVWGFEFRMPDSLPREGVKEIRAACMAALLSITHYHDDGRNIFLSLSHSIWMWTKKALISKIRELPKIVHSRKSQILVLSSNQAGSVFVLFSGHANILKTSPSFWGLSGYSSTASGPLRLNLNGLLVPDSCQCAWVIAFDWV